MRELKMHNIWFTRLYNIINGLENRKINLWYEMGKNSSSITYKQTITFNTYISISRRHWRISWSTARWLHCRYRMRITRPSRRWIWWKITSCSVIRTWIWHIGSRHSTTSSWIWKIRVGRRCATWLRHKRLGRITAWCGLWSGCLVFVNRRSFAKGDSHYLDECDQIRRVLRRMMHGHLFKFYLGSM